MTKHKSYIHVIISYSNLNRSKIIAEKEFTRLFGDAAFKWFDDIMLGVMTEHMDILRDKTLASYHYEDLEGNVYELR